MAREEPPLVVVEIARIVGAVFMLPAGGVRGVAQVVMGVEADAEDGDPRDHKDHEDDHGEGSHARGARRSGDEEGPLPVARHDF